MFLTTLYIIGISAEDMTGTLATGRRKADLFGVIFTALVTAIGGGSIRDMPLGHCPFTQVKHPEYIILIYFCALIATRVPRPITRPESLFLTLGAIGLIVFDVLGAQITINEEYGLIIAISTAVITDAFGKILRDTLCMRIPLVFRRKTYAGIAIISSALYYALVVWVQLDMLVCTIIALIMGVGARLLATKYQWSSPIFSYKEEK